MIQPNKIVAWSVVSAAEIYRLYTRGWEIVKYQMLIVTSKIEVCWFYKVWIWEYFFFKTWSQFKTILIIKINKTSSVYINVKNAPFEGSLLRWKFYSHFDNDILRSVKVRSCLDLKTVFLPRLFCEVKWKCLFRFVLSTIIHQLLHNEINCTWNVCCHETLCCYDHINLCCFLIWIKTFKWTFRV